MVITSTGYYNTGSSAVYDIIKEYSSCSEGKYQGKDLEHLLLYAPDGLFDLEDKLLIGNNIHRSDEAIEVFKLQMERIYKNNFVCFGNLKKYLGEEFLTIVEKFIEDITDFKIKTKWYYDFYDAKFSIVKFVKDIIKLILHKKINGDFAKKLIYREKEYITYSFINSKKFYFAAKQFINYFLKISTTEHDKHLILDHFLLPHNLFRLPNYFDDNIRVFVVDRDPRDVYIQQMNRRHLRNESIPMQIDDYICFWKKLRGSERSIEDKRICRIWFEDLIYHYDEAVYRIENFCELRSEDHSQVGKFFNPDKSIRNTKLYVNNLEYHAEIAQIEKELPEYLFQG